MLSAQRLRVVSSLQLDAGEQDNGIDHRHPLQAKGAPGGEL
jgi:hypothetical protein